MEQVYIYVGLNALYTITACSRRKTRRESLVSFLLFSTLFLLVLSASPLSNYPFGEGKDRENGRYEHVVVEVLLG